MTDAPTSTPGSQPYIVLVLQGGGALGAYHLGAFRALNEAGLTPHWVTGVSIGSINAAVIAGNEPAQQLPRLQTLWDDITSPAFEEAFIPGPLQRLANTGSSLRGLLFGQPGFSRPYFTNPYLAPAGSPEAMGLYDSAPLRATLKRLIDLDLINAQRTRLSLGVTRVRTGNSVFFDNSDPADRPFTFDHILASSAVPPFYAGLRINGELYWDGGVVDNTPLEPVLDDQEANPDRHTLVFMLDLWGGSGTEPRTLDEVLWRYNQIQFASRTDRHLKEVVEKQNMRRMLSQIANQLPEDQRSGLPAFDDGMFFRFGNLDIIRVIYDPPSDQTSLSYLDFSFSSVSERIEQGYGDMKFALSTAPWQRYAVGGGENAPADGQPPMQTRAALHTVARSGIVSQAPGCKIDAQQVVR